MKILFDTKVILDVLLNRTLFIEHSAALLGLVECRKIEGYLCATTITTIDYLITKSINKNTSKIEIKKLLHLFNIASVNSNVLALAVESNFEDAVQYYSAKLNVLTQKSRETLKTIKILNFLFIYLKNYSNFYN